MNPLFKSDFATLAKSIFVIDLIFFVPNRTSNSGLLFSGNFVKFSIYKFNNLLNFLVSSLSSLDSITDFNFLDTLSNSLFDKGEIFDLAIDLDLDLSDIIYIFVYYLNLINIYINFN